MTTLSLASNTRGVFKTLAFASLLASAIGSMSAATITWGGSSGEYLTPANWNGGSVPNTNGGDTAVINGGAVTYTAGGDFSLSGGGSLLINGGSWTQIGGGAWIQLGSGTISVNGGTFNLGTAGKINLGSGGTINVSAGAFNYAAAENIDLSASNSLIITGGTFSMGTGEFSNAGGTSSLSNGTFNARLLKFAGATSNNFNFSSGTINLTDNRAAYIVFKEGPATSYLNFTSGSTGVLNLTAISAADALTVLNRGDIRINGVTDSSMFTIVTNGAGSTISLTASAIPEPSTYAAIAGIAILGVAFMRRRKQA